LPASLGASLAFLSSAFAGSLEAGALPPIDPRKSLTLLVDKVLANALTRPWDAVRLAALSTLLMLSAVTWAPCPERTKAA
jgi:hypothetical protein